MIWLLQNILSFIIYHQITFFFKILKTNKSKIFSLAAGKTALKCSMSYCQVFDLTPINKDISVVA